MGPNLRDSRRYACALLGVCLLLLAAAAAAQPSVPVAPYVKRELQEDLLRALTDARAALAALKAGTSPAARLESLTTTFDAIRAADLLVSNQHRRIAESLAQRGIAPAVHARQEQAASAYRLQMQSLFEHMDRVGRARSGGALDVRTALEELVRFLEERVAPADRRALAASLPYRSLNLPQAPPALGAEVRPAYLQPAVAGPAPEDLADAPEARLEPAILAKAAALNRNPIELFEFVQNDVEIEFYHGAMKGAAETLRQKRGNDVDQASLLVALMRASGIPARYVRGVIALSDAQVLSWTGLPSTRRAADLLTKAGIPFTAARKGIAVSDFRIEHTWIEVLIPYSNYRGAPLDAVGRGWIPLDPSFKRTDFKEPLTNLLDAIGFRADALVPDFLSGIQSMSPMDFYRKKVTDYLAQTRPDLAYDQLLARRRLEPEPIGLLPSTLPYRAASVNYEGARVPEDLRHRVRLTAQGDAGVSLDVTVPLSEILGRRLTLSYLPATVEDQIAVDAFLGLESTPAYLVKLRPVLKVGGVVHTAGQIPVQTGALHEVILEILTPRSRETISNTLVAGGYYAIGLGGQKVVYEPPADPAPEDTERRAADLLYRRAVDFLDRWNRAEEELAGLLRLAVVRPTVSEVIVGTVYNRTLLFGQPHAIEWRGVFVDADLRLSDPVPALTSEDLRSEFMRLSGLAGSALEGEVLERGFQVDAVSAARLVQLATSGGIPVETIDQANIGTVLPLIETTAAVKTDIADAVNQGWRAIVPRREFSRHAWTGIGYILIDSSSGAGGYFISGGLAGGMSSQDPHDWVQQQYVDQLGHPYQDAPNDDPTAAVSIRKVTTTDHQDGTVGKPLARPLAVWVRDASGRPVEGAEVTFLIRSGGGTFDGASAVTVQSDYLGIAEATPTLGTRTSEFSFYVLERPDDTEPTRVGQNIITAAVLSAHGPIFLGIPFQVFAHPDAPHHITKVLGDGNDAPPGTPGGTLLLRVEDVHDNPISNVRAEFTVQPAAPVGGGTLPATARNMVIYPTRPPCQIRTPILGDCDGRSQVSVLTSVLAVGVETILGDTEATRFQVQARVQAEGQVLLETFTLESTGVRAYGTGVYQDPRVLMTLSQLVNDRGELLNSAKVGTRLRRPLETLLFVQEDQYVLEPIPCDVSQPQATCYRIRSLEVTRTRPIDVRKPGIITFPVLVDTVVTAEKVQETATVTFTPTAGGGTTELVENPGGGRYATSLVLGPQPTINEVEVDAGATFWVPYFDVRNGFVFPGLVSAKPGQQVVTRRLFNATDPRDYSTRGDASTGRHFAVGVRASTADHVVLLSVLNTALLDTDISYAINPGGYQAQTAEIDLFEVDPEAPIDADGCRCKWLGLLVGNSRSGAGTARLFQGTAFDPDKEYRIQLVLNRGGDVEIKSDKAALRMFAPSALAARGTRVFTRMNRAGGGACEIGGTLKIQVSGPARVTVKIDGRVFRSSTTGTTYEDVELGRGLHEIPIAPFDVSLPGRHPFEVTAVFERPGFNPETRTAVGLISHEVSITDMLPVGHTLIGGVNLQEGNVSLVREDFTIPGLGSPLQVVRTYTSAGSRSSGSMGAGWTHNYLSRLVREQSLSCSGSAGAVTLIGGEGSGVRFANPQPDTAPDGTPIVRYKPQPGYHGGLTFNPQDGSFDYYTKGRIRHHFTAFDPPASATEFFLSFIEDTHGNRTRLTYEPAPPHNLSTVVDATGRTIRFSYDTFGELAEPRVTKIEGPLGLVVAYAYDAHGNLTNATRDVRSETYVYSVDHPTDKHNLVRTIDPNQRVTVYAYYSAADTFPGEGGEFSWNQVLLAFPDKEKHEFIRSVTDGFGAPEASTHTYTYDYSRLLPIQGVPRADARVVTTITDSRPQPVQTIYTLNPRGNVVEIKVPTAAGDNVTTMRWAYEDGIDDVFMTAKTEPNGRVTRFEHDANGNVAKETIELPGPPYAPVTDKAGNPVATVVTRYEYEQVFNRLTRKTDAEGNVSTYEIDPRTGDTLSTTLDPADGTGPIVARYTYFPNGLKETMRDARGNVTRFEYDMHGNPRRFTDALGNVTTHRHDERSRLLETSDTFGRRSVQEPDALDQVVRVETFAGPNLAAANMASANHVLTYTHVPGGQLRTVTDGLGHVTEYEYDALNREVIERDMLNDADGQVVQYAMRTVYDAAGNPVRTFDRRGTEIVSTYDALNRLTGTSVVENGSPRTIATYTYDAVGNRLTETDLHQHLTRHEYDGLYRRVKTILPLAPYVLTTQYDRVGNALRKTDANGNATTVTHDGLYRVKTQTDAAGRTTRFQYDASGNVTREEHVTRGLVIRREPYDALNRPLQTVQEFTDPLTGQRQTYTTRTRYIDADYTIETETARGVILRERFNGHDQVIEKRVDVAGLDLVTRFRYDGNGNLTGVQDPEGGDIDVAEAFDGLNRKVKTTRPLGFETRTYYDGVGNVVRSVDARGVERRFAFDVLNRPTRESLVESISNGGVELEVRRTEYDDASNATRTFDANRNVLRTELDALHRERRSIDALGQELASEWDGVNRSAVVDRRGIRTEYEYDAVNRLTETREHDLAGAVATTLRTAYLDTENRQVDTDRRGIQAIVQVDPLGRIVRASRRHPALEAEYGAVEIVLEETVYDPAGNKIRVADANGHVTAFTYDGANRRIATTEGVGSPVESTANYAYDGAGNLLRVKDGRGHGGEFDIRYTYDARYRRVAQENGAGELTRFGYDQGDQMITLTEPKGGLTTYAHDERGRLLRVDETRGGAGGVTYFQHDANGNRISQQDANGNLATYRYDALDRLTDIFQHTVAGALTASSPRAASAGGDEPSARRWQFEYDAVANQTAIVDARGQRVETAFDYRNLPVRRDYLNQQPDAEGAAVFPRPVRHDYRFDLSGHLIGVDERKQLDAQTTVTETTTYAYDHLDRAVLTTNYDGKTVRQRYDRAGNRLMVIDADDLPTTYTYDARNRLAGVVGPFGGGTGTTTYTYWPDSLQRTVRHPNGSITETEYDRADRTIQVTNHAGNPADPISRYEYRYDINGNRIAQRESHRQLGGTAEPIAYTYDALNRLTGVTYGGGGTLTYAYAPNGNRISASGVDPNTAAAVNLQYNYDRLNQLTHVRNLADAAASQTFDYDANGNTVREKRGAIDPASGEIPSPAALTLYAYNIRDYLTSAPGEGGRVTFDYDFAGLRVKKNGPVVQTRYLYDQNTVLQEYDATTRATTIKYGYGRDLLSMNVQRGAGRDGFSYLFDGSGSTSELIDETGAVQASYLYDVWGGLRRSADLTGNSRQFTTHYRDPETGLQYFGARYYDDTLGRFLTQDPYMGDVDTPPSLHRYTYAHNSPTRYTDPTGMIAESVWDFASLGIGITSLSFTLNAYMDGEATGADIALDVFGIVADAAALAIPFIPGGASVAIKAARAAKIAKVAKTVDVVQVADRVLNVQQGLQEAVLAAGEGQDLKAVFFAGMAGLGIKGAKDKTAKILGNITEGSRKTIDVPQQFLKHLDGPVDMKAIMESKDVRDFYKAYRPASGVADADAIDLQKLIESKNFEIGIRAPDPVTATESKWMAQIPGLKAKPESVVEKSFFNYVPAQKGGEEFRGDYDIAWVRDLKTGRFLTNREVLDLVVKPLAAAAEGRGVEASFQHGAHFRMLERFREKAGELFAKFTGRDPSAATAADLKWAAMRKFVAVDGPGSVEVFAPGKSRLLMTAPEVQQFARDNRLPWHPLWKSYFQERTFGESVSLAMWKLEDWLAQRRLLRK